MVLYRLVAVHFQSSYRFRKLLAIAPEIKVNSRYMIASRAVLVHHGTLAVLQCISSTDSRYSSRER